jgi:hypothetical protein
MEGVQDGSIELLPDDWASFLYPAGTVYNAEDEEKDLLRGYLVVRVCVFLFLTTFLTLFPVIGLETHSD